MTFRQYADGLNALRKLGRSYGKPKKRTRIRCDQCEALMINGVFCHETGCPNARKRYDAESDEWIAQRECFDCGCTIDADDPCCSDENLHSDY